MLLRITSTTPPATDLGYLLHKHPGRVHRFTQAFGEALVFYPEAHAARCTAAMLLHVDPISLVRGRRPGDFLLEPYVNDRPYVLSSFLSVALGDAFGTALSGRSKERPELAAAPQPFAVQLTGLPCRGGEGLLRALFEPLGYTIAATRRPLDPAFPAWGESAVFDVELLATTTLQRLLQHLYVLVPVLDDDKHYWVGEDEVDKLLRHAQQWLATHPEKERIAARYLRHQRRLTSLLLSQLVEEDEDPDRADEEHGAAEVRLERPIDLGTRRRDRVLEVLRASASRRVADLGCGEGRLLEALLREKQFDLVLGVDVSATALARAAGRLGVERWTERQRARLSLLHGSLVYRDRRLHDVHAATAIEVIEHLDPGRLDLFTRNLLAFVDAPLTIVSTPNVEYNVRFPALAAGRFRHHDHRFEWTRAQFAAWAEGSAQQYGREVELVPVGDVDPGLGPPTQMAVFRARGAS
ncbi:MAG TPA: 3' terminal RNA ribose 2'-O-methyltransferase Hen1, partial [Planctomycetota bacterium]|nr:3' terminal RNA ribose 2'-O-methyltransferase Hen1 [Planctomycetota bacterium]